MNSRITQITTIITIDKHLVITALCVDGSLWQKWGEEKWIEIDVEGSKGI